MRLMLLESRMPPLELFQHFDLQVGKNFFLAFVVTTGSSIISIEIAVDDVAGFN